MTGPPSSATTATPGAGYSLALEEARREVESQRCQIAEVKTRAWQLVGRAARHDQPNSWPATPPCTWVTTSTIVLFLAELTVLAIGAVLCASVTS